MNIYERCQELQVALEAANAKIRTLDAENEKLHERVTALVEGARRRVPQNTSIITQALASMARAGLDAKPAMAALDELTKLASAYPAARAKAEVDAERDTNQRLTEEVDRLRTELGALEEERNDARLTAAAAWTERDEAVGLLREARPFVGFIPCRADGQLTAVRRAMDLILARVAPAKEDDRG